MVVVLHTAICDEHEGLGHCSEAGRARIEANSRVHCCRHVAPMGALDFVLHRGNKNEEYNYKSYYNLHNCYYYRTKKQTKGRFYN